MKNEKIYDEWTKFLNHYSEYFVTDEENWHQKFSQLKKYINSNKKRPSQVDKNKDTANLGKWLSHQLENYKSKKYIMKDKKIYDEWDNFMNEYSEYF